MNTTSVPDATDTGLVLAHEPDRADGQPVAERSQRSAARKDRRRAKSTRVIQLFIAAILALGIAAGVNPAPASASVYDWCTTDDCRNGYVSSGTVGTPRSPVSATCNARTGLISASGWLTPDPGWSAQWVYIQLRFTNTQTGQVWESNSGWVRAYSNAPALHSSWVYAPTQQTTSWQVSMRTWKYDGRSTWFNEFGANHTMEYVGYSGHNQQQHVSSCIFNR